MKAILEFNLPEDSAAFMAAVKAEDTKIAVEDLRNDVRSRLKHGPEPDRDFVEEIYQTLLNIAPYT